MLGYIRLNYTLSTSMGIPSKDAHGVPKQNIDLNRNDPKKNLTGH